MLAVFFNATEAAELLLAHGADPTYVNSEGSSVLAHASEEVRALVRPPPLPSHRVGRLGWVRETDGGVAARRQHHHEGGDVRRRWAADARAAAAHDRAAPCARRCAVSTPDAPHLFVLGGKAKDCATGTSSYSSALHVLNVETGAWSRKSAQADFVDNDALDSWDGREGHSATLVGAYIYVFGGVNDESGFTGKNDLLRLGVRPEAESGKFVWTILQRGGDAAPSARKGHVAALLSHVGAPL